MEYRKIVPDYGNIHEWEDYSCQLPIELRQSIEEGKALEEYRELFSAVDKLKPGRDKSELSDILYRIVVNAKQDEDFRYNEPSELDKIRAERRACEIEMKKPDSKTLEDKIAGAWLGRICGCLLGKPVEGMRTNELIPFLKESGNYPMHRYIVSADLKDEERYSFRFWKSSFADVLECAPSDDDTNYVVLAQKLIERYGRDFTPEDVAKTWVDLQPKDAYCTAERVAFRNFVAGYVPPVSAVYKNPYREWIGAQIRGDYFGYINPGKPEAAAEMAWRDASISHIKNGIYGEMFVSAMLACAAECDSMVDIICGGLAEIPYRSRLHEAIMTVMDGYKNGVSYEECMKNIYTRFDEHVQHDWCHTISNAMIVSAVLLYGEGDYSRSICMAVEAGFDTDCNGATVGSVIGMKNGAGCIGKEWTEPVRGMLDTAIFGVGRVSISDCVIKTMKHM